jgi:outer membrane receptor protein involved in Fe transport
LATTAFLPLLSGLPAAGQTASSPGIEEVVVTATRQEQPLSKVAVSVSAFTAEKMDALGVKNFADLAKFTPGVTFDPDSNDISIRGIDSSAGAGTTGIYIDDTPIQIRNLGFNSNNSLPSVFDLERVEVLRGPQGTLFGAGSEGGTVRYITPQPSLTDYSGFARSEISFTQNGAPSFELGAAFGGPIVDDVLGFRASAWFRRDGGWIDRVNYQTDQTTMADANEVNTYVVRGALTWAPISNLTVTPGIDYQSRRQRDADQYWIGISDPGSDTFRNGTPDFMPDNDRFYLPTLRVQYSVPSMEVISNTSYFNRAERTGGYSGTLYNLSYFQQLINPNQPGGPTDPNLNPCPQCASNLYPLLTPNGINLPGLPNYKAVTTITNLQENWTQEVRLQSTDPDARLTWVAGVFYSSNKQESREEINDPQLAAITQYLFGETVEQAWGEQLLPNGDDYINDTIGHDTQTAVFGDASFRIIDTLKLEVGLRFAKTHFDFTNYANGPQNFGYSSGTGQQSETPFTPKGGLSWQVTPDDLVYATVAKGYRIGGANPPFPLAACQADLQNLGVSNVPESYSSDKVLSYELGSKDKFLDGRVSIAASAYYINWNRIQQFNYLPSCGFQYTANLGQAISDGFDLQAQIHLSDSILLDTSVGYTDARYSANSRSGSAPNAPLIAAEGDSLGAVPWTVTFGAEYDFTALSYDSFIRADYEFASHNPWPLITGDPLTTSYDPGLVNDPATNLVSVRGGATIGSWDVSLFMNNVLNAHPQLDLNHQDQYTLLYEASTSRPRTGGIEIEYRY